MWIRNAVTVLVITIGLSTYTKVEASVSKDCKGPVEGFSEWRVETNIRSACDDNSNRDAATACAEKFGSTGDDEARQKAIGSTPLGQEAKSRADTKCNNLEQPPNAFCQSAALQDDETPYFVISTFQPVELLTGDDRIFEDGCQISCRVRYGGECRGQR